MHWDFQRTDRFKTSLDLCKTHKNVFLNTTVTREVFIGEGRLKSKALNQWLSQKKCNHKSAWHMQLMVWGARRGTALAPQSCAFGGVRLTGTNAEQGRCYKLGSGNLSTAQLQKRLLIKSACYITSGCCLHHPSLAQWCIPNLNMQSLPWYI